MNKLIIRTILVITFFCITAGSVFAIQGGRINYWEDKNTVIYNDNFHIVDQAFNFRMFKQTSQPGVLTLSPNDQLYIPETGSIGMKCNIFLEILDCKVKLSARQIETQDPVVFDFRQAKFYNNTNYLFPYKGVGKIKLRSDTGNIFIEPNTTTADENQNDAESTRNLMTVDGCLLVDNATEESPKTRCDVTTKKKVISRSLMLYRQRGDNCDDFLAVGKERCIDIFFTDNNDHFMGDLEIVTDKELKAKIKYTIPDKE